MEARFRTRMDRSLDEIAAEMHSEQARDLFAKVYEERAFVGAEPSFQRSSSSRRHAPYPDMGGSSSYSQERKCDSLRPRTPSDDGAAAGDVEANTKLFVGNLNYSTTWQALKDHMRRAGQVQKCAVFTDSSGKSKGMGLVQYESADGAERALVELKDTVLDGRRLFLRKHMDPIDREKSGLSSKRTNTGKPPGNPAATVFVQNLDYSVSWQKLKDILKVAGKIVNVDLAKDKDGRSKGHATVQFSEPSEAINAIALFHGQILSDRPMRLRMDSSASYQPDPIQLRLSGLARATPNLRVPPPPSLPPQGVLEATPTNSLGFPFLTAVISSLTAKKVSAMLIQNGALGSSGGMGSSQQFAPPTLPHPQFHFDTPPISLFGSMSPDTMDRHGAERYSHDSGSRGSEIMKNRTPQNCKVFVANLNFKTTWHQLKNIFRTAGPVKHVEIFKHSSGRSKGCGVVVFLDSESALKAIRMFNDKMVDGRKISVTPDQVDSYHAN